MRVPLHPSTDHLTASSSAIANYSRIALHSFNSAAGQSLPLGKKREKNTVAHQGLMGVGRSAEQLLWDSDVRATTEERLLCVPTDPEHLWSGRPEDCVDSVLKDHRR